MSNISMFQEAEKAKEIIIRDGKIYATQKGMAMAFGVLISSISNILKTAKKQVEVDFSAVLYDFREGSGITGGQNVTYYPFYIITMVGFRLRKEGATAKFMEWASGHLQSLITTGVSVDHGVLSRQKDKQNIVDDLWRRVTFTEREINRMLEVVIDEEDAKKNSDVLGYIRSCVTNKARVAATGMTAAQIKLARCCHKKANLGMNVSGTENPDPQTARNYLFGEELEKSCNVEQQFVLILKGLIHAEKRIKITELMDKLDHLVEFALYMDVNPVEMPEAGLNTKATAHVIEQGKLAELLLEGGNSVDTE